jgi:hypothetical protein
MTSNKKIQFPYYSGQITDSKVKGYVTLDKFISAQQNPTRDMNNLFLKIREATEHKNIALKRSLKTNLFAFTPSVQIKLKERRKYTNIIQFTGLMQLDFDGIESKETAKDLKHYLFENYQQIVCSYLSPSGKGVKCLLRIKKVDNVDNFKAIHKAVREEFEKFDGFDNSTQNPILPLFLSLDKQILWREFSECTTWFKEDWSKPTYETHLEIQPLKIDPNNDYARRVKCITENRINAIVDNGHPQVRSTALVLGSRVCAGYIDRYDAEKLITNLIISNSYLQKELQNYIKTALWGIENGMKSPRYFNN